MGARPLDQFDLRSRVRFDHDASHIWLEGNRMLMVHARALGGLRRELVDAFGVMRAQAVMWRFGFECGRRDADCALKLSGGVDNYDFFRIGPEMHGLEGVVKAEIAECQIDWEKGAFTGTIHWEGSWEAEAHLQHFGEHQGCACWSLEGYASGFTTQFFKRFIVFREVECVCSGKPRCVSVGKPFEDWEDKRPLEHLRVALSADNRQVEIEDELRALRNRMSEERAWSNKTKLGDLVGASKAFLGAFDLLRKAAHAPINVLLLGETGVGKEMFARWLHENSDRAHAPLVVINCAAMPAELVEIELFGVSGGLHPTPHEARPGRFERADGGTLFLDEISELPPAAQAKLLRALQTGEVERVGDSQPRKVDVRIVSSTNADLQAAIAEKRFRPDLYYRLATYPIPIPPLRERKTDIPLLATAMLQRFQPAYNKAVNGISDGAMKVLMAHDWPGNVRELENILERAVLLSPPGAQIEVDVLPLDLPFISPVQSVLNASGNLTQPGAGDASDKLYEALLDQPFDLAVHESRLMELAVRRANGNLTQAARMLGVSRRQLAYRMKSAGKDVEDEPGE